MYIKILTSFLLGLIVVIFLNSCEKQTIDAPLNSIKHKEQSKNSKSQSIKVKEDRLVFTTVEDYDNTIAHLSQIPENAYSAWENSKGFNSMRKQHQHNLENLPVPDVLFATLLNPDGLVQISEWIFKINMPDSSVYVLEEENILPSDIHDLVNLIVNNKIEKYSINDNVLEIIGLRTLGCGETNRSADWIEGYTPTIYSPTTGGTYRVKVRCAYNKGGIYFNLKSHFNWQFFSAGVWYSITNTNAMPAGAIMRFDHIHSKRKPRCKPCESSFEGNTTSTNYEAARTHHSSTRGLHYYLVNVQFSAKIQNTNYVTSPFYTFQSWFSGSTPPC